MKGFFKIELELDKKILPIKLGGKKGDLHL
jgi:hypothetical protein